MRRLSIGLIVHEVKCIVFIDMQEMSHDHSVLYYHLPIYNYSVVAGEV